MTIVISIAICGALGCLSRYFISYWVNQMIAPSLPFGISFPYGTFAVNILGSFLLGLVMEFSLRSTLIPPNLRVGITTGFMGGLTTFSTFSYETFRLLQDGELLLASTNAVANVIVCIVFSWVGIMAAQML